MPNFMQSLLGEGDEIFNIKCPSHMTKMALSMQHHLLELYKVNINDDPGFTLTYFTAMSN